MTDNKSFETVELFNPIELTPIDGIEMPKPVAMPEPVAEPKPVAVQKTDAVQEKGVMQESAADKEPVVVPEKAEVGSIWDEIHKKSTPEFYQQGNDVQYDRGGFDQGSFDQNSQFYNENRDNNSPNAADIDLKNFYKDIDEQKRKQEEDRKKKNLLLGVGVFCMAFIVAAIGFKRGASRRSNETNINVPVQKVIATNDYARQDEVYGTISFDPSGDQSAQFFDISPEVIEYTGPFERTLFFEYTPKADNKVLRVEVEMLDRYGNSFGTVGAFKKNVPAGEKAIIDIPFGIDQFIELNGITYNITTEGYTLQTPEGDKNIVSTEQADDVLSVTIEGGLNVDRDAYVLFYKDGRVCSVMRGVPSYNSNGKATFYLGDIDYDNYEVFY